jgi:sensor histidine kinase YesM
MNTFFRYKIDHVLFWLLTIFFHAYTQQGLIEKEGPGIFLIEIIVRNGLLACSIYLTILLAIPKLTNEKHVHQGIIILFAATVIYVAGKNAHDTFLLGNLPTNNFRQGFFRNTFYNLSIIVFYQAFASTLYLSKQWYEQREQMRRMQVEKLNTELDYLRAQLNPHFLFNSINTIYFLIDKKNQAARDTLVKFSEMLRYQLYECTAQTIDIEKEIQYLKNYTALQQLRMNDNFTVQFICHSSLNGFSIPPLLMLPLVENAFKHVSHFTNRKNEISIQLTLNHQHLQLHIANTKEPYPVLKETGGIGLRNVKRRLELIYGDQYQLKTQNTIDHYSITLEIPIL